jgi:DNA modification methylase
VTDVRILEGDVRAVLPTLPENSVHCVITSPPYLWLRDDGHADQIGLEPTIDAFIATLVGVFREVRRVLRADGTLWLNMGDSYASGGYSGGGDFMAQRAEAGWNVAAEKTGFRSAPPGFNRKDLFGMPWRLAFALQADGWILRSDIIWEKPNCMPESADDRPTRSHEYLFLLAKSEHYFYDKDAIMEDVTGGAHTRGGGVGAKTVPPGRGPQGRVRDNESFGKVVRHLVTKRNKRTVWSVPTQHYKGAHYATFPEDLVRPCVLAGTSAGGCCSSCGAPLDRKVEIIGPSFKELTKDREPSSYAAATLKGSPHSFAVRGSHGHIHRERRTIGWERACKCDAPTAPCVVLDPFGGSGTVGAVAVELGRSAVLVELSAEYSQQARARVDGATERAGFITPAKAEGVPRPVQLGLLAAGEAE